MDISLIVQGAAALLLVLALIVLIAWVLKRYFSGDAQQGQTSLRRRSRRLSIVEAAPLGARHRLVLVRRDDVEHLLLIGGTTELVVEAGIPRAPAVADVNIRAVEPRFDPNGHTPISEQYEPVATHREPEVAGGFSSRAFDRPSFEPSYRPHGGEVEDRDEPGLSPADENYDEGQEDEEQEEDEPGYGRSDAGEFYSSDRPGFHRPEPSPFGRSEHSGLFSDRAGSLYSGDEPLLRPSIEDTDDNDVQAIDRDALDSSERNADDVDEDRADSAQSRILSRFLKRDES